MNNAITAPFVRLVSDDGHNVVPRHEALQMAARKDMDLVEVRPTTMHCSTAALFFFPQTKTHIIMALL